MITKNAEASSFRSGDDRASSILPMTITRPLFAFECHLSTEGASYAAAFSLGNRLACLSTSALAQYNVPEPRSIAAKCNKEAGGWYSHARKSWVVSGKQVAAKNDCVYRMTHGKQR